MSDIKDVLLKEIGQYDFGDMPMSSAESFRKNSVNFVNSNSLDTIDTVVTNFQSKLEELCEIEEIGSVSLSQHFKELEKYIPATDGLFREVIKYVSEEIINMNETIGRNSMFDRNNLIFDLSFFFEMIGTKVDFQL